MQSKAEGNRAVREEHRSPRAYGGRGAGLASTHINKSKQSKQAKQAKKSKQHRVKPTVETEASTAAVKASSTFLYSNSTRTCTAFLFCHFCTAVGKFEYDHCTTDIASNPPKTRTRRHAKTPESSDTSKQDRGREGEMYIYIYIYMKRERERERHKRGGQDVELLSVRHTTVCTVVVF